MDEYNNSPYRKMPEELIPGYTMNGKIPIFNWYFDGSKQNGVEWNNQLINEYVNRFTPNNIKNNGEGRSPYGHKVCVNLLNAFEKYNVRNNNVAVVGSETPWIEAILINLQNKVTTIEYNVPDSNYHSLECKDYFNFFENNNRTFDAVVTFSSIEHSGLGRYGDPLDPNGDIKTMEVIHNNLIDNGVLIWGAPVGKDAISWNAHRVYGEIRLPLMFAKFKELDWYGVGKNILFNRPLQKNSCQPVIVLQRRPF